MAYTGLVLLALVCLFPSNMYGRAESYEVVKTGWCTADIKAGGKTYSSIDLTSLDSGDPTKPAFAIVGGGYTYLYQPCSGMSVNTACSSFQAVCQNGGNAFYAAGRQNYTTFGFIGLGTVALHYAEDPSDPSARHSHFMLECDSIYEHPNITFIDEKPAGNYNFVFRWADFCSQIPLKYPAATLGIGDILLIVFFPTLILYFVVGMVIQKVVRGAEGIEIIPCVSFWASLPGLIKDGCFFIVSPCCGDGGGGGGSGKASYDAL